MPIFSAGVATVTAAAALTRTNDTNVTVTLGGAPNTALLAATSLTLGWTGHAGHRARRSWPRRECIERRAAIHDRCGRDDRNVRHGQFSPASRTPSLPVIRKRRRKALATTIPVLRPRPLLRLRSRHRVRLLRLRRHRWSTARPPLALRPSMPARITSTRLAYTAAALTKTDDTNVTLTLGGTPGDCLVAGRERHGWVDRHAFDYPWRS